MSILIMRGSSRFLSSSFLFFLCLQFVSCMCRILIVFRLRAFVSDHESCQCS
ncbi:hypothetical protein JHK84_032069 [Glycine max]|nr:hypothetical protein JHK84_032069 [Glycine max]